MNIPVHLNSVESESGELQPEYKRDLEQRGLKLKYTDNYFDLYNYKPWQTWLIDGRNYAQRLS